MAITSSLPGRVKTKRSTPISRQKLTAGTALCHYGRLISIALFSGLITGASYPIDRHVGETEVAAYAARVEKVLPSSWKLFKEYNPYGFGFILIRTVDNTQFYALPFGERRYLELLIDLAAKEYPRSAAKITRQEFARKERIRLEIETKQRELLSRIGVQNASQIDTTEYLPIKLEHAPTLIEYNKLVDAMRMNEKNFPRYFTETFGVTFHYPKNYEIGHGVSVELAKRFHEMVEKVKAMFPKYEFEVR